MFKGILTAEAVKKNGAQAMKRGLEAAAKAAGSGSSSGSGSACKQQRSVQHAYETSTGTVVDEKLAWSSWVRVRGQGTW